MTIAILCKSVVQFSTFCTPQKGEEEKNGKTIKWHIRYIFGLKKVLFFFFWNGAKWKGFCVLSMFFIITQNLLAFVMEGNEYFNFISKCKRSFFGENSIKICILTGHNIIIPLFIPWIYERIHIHEYDDPNGVSDAVLLILIYWYYYYKQCVQIRG